MPKNRQTVTGGNVDVEALFGAQAQAKVTKPTKNKGTRLAPRVSSLTHGDSFAPEVKNGELDTKGLSPQAVTENELRRMRDAETEQSRVDGFWGLDKEYRDRCVELDKMLEEDICSAENERLWSISTLQRQWEEEERKRLEDVRLTAAVDEEHARLGYMESFFSSQSSGNILQYAWPTRPGVTVQPDTNTNTGPADYKEGYDILCSDFGNISTIHVNGLQRGQEVSIEGQIAEGKQSKAIATLAMRQSGTRQLPMPGDGSKERKILASPRNGGMTPASPSRQQQQSYDYKQDQQHWLLESEKETAKQSQRLRGGSVNLLDVGRRYIKDSNSLLAGTESKHNDLYDGHPIYRWDQEQMLRVVFVMLDDSNQGRIGRAQISEMARSVEIQGILKYTVFWLPLKRRQWTFFYNIFDDDAEYIGIDDWIQAGRGLARCEEVSVSHVRLDLEHQRVAEECSVTGEWNKERFASETRSQKYKEEIAASTLRLVAPGDLVWALYSKGCRWLPAKVVRIHNTDGHCLSNSTLSVQYIMSTDEFKQTKIATETREYMPKSRTPKSSQQVSVKPVRSEAEVCAYIYDLVDQDRKGVVEPNALIVALSSETMTENINSSSWLSLLVKNEKKLLTLLTELFPTSVEDGGGLTKIEFIEYCSLIETMNVGECNSSTEHKETDQPPSPLKQAPAPQEISPKFDNTEEDDDDPFVISQY